MLKLKSAEGMNAQSLMSLLDELNDSLNNRPLTDPGLVIGSSSAATVKIANTTKFLIDGVFKSKTTAEITFTAGDDITADASTIQEAIYVLSLDASGAGTLTKGATASGSGNAVLPEYNDLPESEAVIGYVRVAVDAGSTDFDAGSDDLSAAHLTDTFVSLGYIFPRFDAIQ